MTRTDWHNARRERRRLADWLACHTHPGDTWSTYADLYRRNHATYWDLHCLIESAKTRDPNGWRILRENQCRRRSHVKARITHRKREAMVREPGETLIDYVSRKTGFVPDRWAA